MEKIRELQLKELGLLKRFVQLCEENNLRYFLLGGTLLGAIRHKGFIPWDDDVDVAMPRVDYEKFLIIAQKKLDEPYFIDDIFQNHEYRYGFARMSDESMYVINHSAQIPRKEAISIDIIPLDGFPDNGIKRMIHKLKLSFWWNLNQIIQFDELVDRKRKRSKAGNFFVYIAGKFKWIGKILDYRVCLRHITKILKRYPYDSDMHDVINFLAAFGFQEVFPRDSFGIGKVYQFEDLFLKGPVDYDCVCKTIYGVDYMKFPPVDERNKHNTEIVQ